KLFSAAPGRKVVVQIIIELDPVKTGVPGQLEALAQVHLIGVRESPLVDRFFHLVAFGFCFAVSRSAWPFSSSHRRSESCRARGGQRCLERGAARDEWADI